MRTVKKYIQSILGIILSFFIGATMAEKKIEQYNVGKAALKKVQASQAKRDRIDDVALIDLENMTEPDRFTQSEAQLQLKSVRKLLENDYENKVTPYLNIVFDALKKERKFRDSHYVFYHATPTNWAVVSDLFTQLTFAMHPEKEATEFKFLRFEGEGTNMSSRQFLVDELKKNGLVDDSGDLGKILLSVNLALFGSAGSKTDCTWGYFMGSTERVTPNAEVYRKMMDNFGLTHKYIDEILELENIIYTKEYSLLQIFVPIGLVDDIAYLAWLRGIPAHAETMQWIKDNVKFTKGRTLKHTKEVREQLAGKFKTEREKNPAFKDLMETIQEGDFSVNGFLKIYRNKPWELPGLNETQARILFTPDGLLNPNSGIKFYRFVTTPRSKLQEYNTKLNEVVQKIINEKKTLEGVKAGKNKAAAAA